VPGDPLPAEARCEAATAPRLAARAEIRWSSTCDAERFLVRTELEAFENR
jgi:hypothetical protein